MRKNINKSLDNTFQIGSNMFFRRPANPYEIVFKIVTVSFFAATSLSALAQEANDGFRLKAASISYSNSRTSVSDTVTPTGFFGGVPNNLGSAETNSISLGLSASFSSRLSGGIGVAGSENKGSLQQRYFDLNNKNNSSGYSAYLNYQISAPIIVGVFAGQTSSSGTLSNTVFGFGTDSAGFSSKSENLGVNLSTIWPVAERSLLGISLAYNTSSRVTRYEALPGVIFADTSVKNKLDLLNLNVALVHFINDKWRVRAGLTAHQVTRQETPDGDTRHSSHWLTPSVGLAYRFDKTYEAFFRHVETSGDAYWKTRASTLGLSYTF
jgi:hypothetical protein